MTAVVVLDIGGPSAPWAAIGLTVADECSWVGGVMLRFGAPGDGVVSWELDGSPQRPERIDGLATTYVDDVEVDAWQHPVGAIGLDHVVVMTSSLERTCGEVERVTGEPLKRIREAGPVRQGFHRLGPLIVEVVETDRITGDHASFWGFVVNVDDIDAVFERLGPDVLSPPKQAVQPGRRIASFRSAAGLGAPIALMTTR
ncbi:MAG: hypothetical protein WD023_08895 [Ilumatobacteraceae bacterium]